MELNIFFAFVVATTIMIALPGPSVLLTISHSIAFGWKTAIITVLGATAGIAIQLALTAIGMASIVHFATEIFTWARWIGAGYLVYLGIKQWRSSDTHPNVNAAPQTMNVFVQGVIVTVLNPKSLVFIAAFLPQFIHPSHSLGLQLSIIIPTFLLITFIITSLWAIAAGSARDMLQNEKLSRPMLRTAGGFMVLAGLGMAMTRRSN
ncbi:LysE family translocator [Desulfovibrio inopinatus]|uniref:LysE family translocator n=1 Tax=Desulfovibrio inopinatus TaxID=102109 RepID=UPI000487A85B|nr:LysE family translocator [Desulfovibrio inopinatus]